MNSTYYADEKIRKRKLTKKLLENSSSKALDIQENGRVSEFKLDTFSTPRGKEKLGVNNHIKEISPVCLRRGL